MAGSSQFRRESGLALPGSVLTDPLLPPLTLDQAELFRAKVAPQLEELDRAAMLFGDHARLADDTTLPFGGLARQCGQSPEVAWDDIIRGHFRHVATSVATAQNHSRSLSDKLRDSPICYLTNDHQMSSPDPYCASVLVDELHVTMSAESQGAIALASEDFAHRMDDHEAWLRAGRAALLDLTVTQDFVVTKNRSEHGDLFAVTSSTRYTASVAIVLMQAVRQWTGMCLDNKSVLFAVPAQDLLLFQVVDSTRLHQELSQAIPEVMRHTVGAFHAAPAPLSAAAFLWHQDQVRRVSYVEGDTLQVLLPTF